MRTATQQSLKLRKDPASAAAARRFIGRVLREVEHMENEEVAVLLTNELVTNAILHADSDIDVVIDVEAARVRVEVRDESHRRPWRRHCPVDATSGRGLELVECLATAWGVEGIPGDGKTVWFELGVGPS